MNTLLLTKGPKYYTPADHISQEIALMHFSNGSVAITHDRLDEIIYTAGIHGWQVSVTNKEGVSHD